MAAYKGNLNAAKSFAGRGAIITNDYDEVSSSFFIMAQNRS
jgi:hypothetical protein